MRIYALYMGNGYMFDVGRYNVSYLSMYVSVEVYNVHVCFNDMFVKGYFHVLCRLGYVCKHTCMNKWAYIFVLAIWMHIL